ncbi:MAG: hypothetical protein IPL43_13325 [Micropruina sp.]|nr:hypothetical protein [Micropruina sp.]
MSSTGLKQGQSREAGQPGRPSERGMATVELAFASLVTVVVTYLMVALIAVIVAWTTCHDTAAEVARQAARHDQAAVSRVIGDRPAGSEVTIRRAGSDVVVTVKLLARPWGHWLPGVALEAEATVLSEGE